MNLGGQRNPRWARTLLIAYGFMLPLLGVKAVYTFWPILFGTYLAFTEYNLISPPRWVGLRNFEELFGVGAFGGRGPDRDFWYGLINSLKYVLVVPLIQILSIGLAMLVNRQIPLIGLFRTAYYVPVVTSFAVVGLMWGWMYNAFGPVNFILTRLHLLNPENPSSLLSNPATALLAVMFVTLWKGLGYYMVLYLAGLQSIDRSLEEAALMDGASRWQVFRHVTLPGLRPTILVCSLLSTISAIKVFDEIFVMTGGGPAGSTYTAMFFVYSAAFQNFRYGYAAAAGLVVAGVSLGLGLLNFRLTRGGQAS
ncbi:carbohydrate ABC transporter permease [Meiothermus granaticius]|uniref:Lactose transport system permease protein LacF n=1 Tax=Meiothermus granaticius NBRC 107808 TaxID=1227551 RepID=A0A399FAW9_9DEIN|nr:sugar ABC transporter permease [Meiothermus granaticius]RIH93280.1 Lactose transport system permease protein LacF [Meiothermus granaticius NBRC 107808]GEM85913.1 sugar ABC transporter permease [Meiothermus granaticius NBRC 107808]